MRCCLLAAVLLSVAPASPRSLAAEEPTPGTPVAVTAAAATQDAPAAQATPETPPAAAPPAAQAPETPPTTAAPAQPAAPAPAAPVRRIRLGIARLTHDHVHGILGRGEDKGDVEIVGIAEPDSALAARYAEQHKIPADRLYPDLATMLEKAKPEAVAAFGSTLEHLGVVEACAPRRIHVMVEKPLATNVADARRMAELARQHGIALLTNYETTWYGSNHALHARVLGEGAIGAIRRIVVHDGHTGPVAIGVSPEFLSWLADPEKNGGGALMDFGCYGANLATWLMKGERPQGITAVTQQIQPKAYPRVDDEATIVLTYPQAQAIIQASWNWPFDRKDLHVYGEKGYVYAVGPRALRVRRGDAEQQVQVPAPPKPRRDAFAFFAAVARGDAQVAPDEPSSLELNLVVMEILDAARESARTGRTVQLGSAAK